MLQLTVIGWTEGKRFSFRVAPFSSCSSGPHEETGRWKELLLVSCFSECRCNESSCPKRLGTKCPTQAVVSYLGEGAGMNSSYCNLLVSELFSPRNQKTKEDATHTRQPGKDSRCRLQFLLLWPTIGPSHWYSTFLFHIGDINLCAWFIGSWCTLHYKCEFDLLTVLLKVKGLHFRSIMEYYFGWVVDFSAMWLIHKAL